MNITTILMVAFINIGFKNKLYILFRIINRLNLKFSGQYLVIVIFDYYN